MGRKLRNVLIFLLIILEEPSMQEAQCLCEPPSRVLYLSLCDNQITTIHSGIFGNLPHLQELWLGKNQIAVIQSGTFANLPKLQKRTRNPPLGPNPGAIGTNSNTGVSVMASDQDHQYEDIDNHQDQTGQGQFQTITESTTNTTATQHSVYKDVDQSQTTTSIATVMTSGHDQTGQGQYQAINESLDARNLSYGTRPTALRVNSVYTKVETP
ncbi:PREDICTED: uncharacterized protein LOC109472388 [Branchiostoma belcheri]|uniref:Uncharacterized protein LOC109472388 n=1 Tax=Branchiostoma belcheri TaxID=7741 RepID=A0A6P4YEU0_BRABE|nr:PREDICTED: uncharacterized protein LOC109472388 [Branchiostoma belcheri]